MFDMSRPLGRNFTYLAALKVVEKPLFYNLD